MCNVSFLFVSKFLLLKEMTWAIYIDFFFWNVLVLTNSGDYSLEITPDFLKVSRRRTFGVVGVRFYTGQIPGARFFYRLGSLSATRPTLSKYWRNNPPKLLVNHSVFEHYIGINVLYLVTVVCNLPRPQHAILTSYMCIFHSVCGCQITMALKCVYNTMQVLAELNIMVLASEVLL